MGEEKVKPKKIFISYGRKDAQELVFKLEKDLKEEGHEVWLDKREIEPGEYWEQEIEDGILNAEIFIALLSPHAVRRPDGVCLDEISMARYNDRKIIPAMLMMCRPPLGIYRLDWVDFQNWQNENQYKAALKCLLETFDKEVVAEGTYSRIFSELKPLDFGIEIARHIREFIGREWLLKELDDWLEIEESRVFFITGDPGIGKSAIMAYLVHKHQQVVAYHFCVNNLKDSLNPIRFIQSIAAQLATQLENYRGALEAIKLEELIDIGDPNVLLRRIIADPLKSEHPDKPVLIIVDGLDEGFDENYPNIVSVLRDRLNDLPTWVRLVLSSRKELEIIDLFSEFQPYEIDASRSENLQDIDNYLEIKLKDSEIARRLKASGVNAGEFAKTIAQKGEGNFLYVVNAVIAVKDGLMDPSHPETFPPGLVGLYKIFFGRIFPKGQDYEEFRLILDVIIAAREPLTAKQIGNIVNRSAFNIRKDLQKLASFFPRRNQCYQVYHKSLKDWLLGEAGQDLTYQVDVEGGHNLIADNLLQSYQNKKIDLYLLNHLPQHLLALEKWKDLSKLMSDLNYIKLCFEAGETQNLIKNFLDILASDDLPDNSREKVQEFKKFVLNQAHFLRKYPHLIVQQALNQPDRSELFQAGQKIIELMLTSYPWVEWINKPQKRDPCLLTLEGHSGVVYGCAFSQDGSKILAALENNTLILWNAKTGSEIRIFKGHSNRALSCSFSPDGTKILSASRDKTLKLWETETGVEIHTLEGHFDAVMGCTFSPDGKKVISTSLDKTLKLWNVKTGKEIKTFKGHSGGVLGCSFSPDGKSIITTSQDRTLKLWNVQNGNEVRAFVGHSAVMPMCAFSPDGKTVLSASSDKTLKLWNTETGEVIRTFIGHFERVTGCDYSLDGTIILSSSRDGTLKLWDINTGIELNTYKGHTDAVTGCIFSPDGTKVLSTSRDGTLKIWDIKMETENKTYEGHAGWVSKCVISPDGTKILSSSWDGILKLWDIDKKEAMIKFDGNSGPVMGCAISPDGKMVLSAPWDGVLRLWDVETGEEIKSFKGHTDGILECTFSPDGRKLLSASRDGSLKLWDIEGDTEIRTFTGHKGWVFDCEFSPDGSKIVSASWDGTLKLWDVETGAEIGMFKGHSDMVFGCTFSPDGMRVLSASQDKTLKLWNIKTREVINTFKTLSNKLAGWNFSPDGSKIIYAPWGENLRFCDVEKVNELFVFPTFGDTTTFTMCTNGLMGIGDYNGNVYFLRLHGLNFKPAIVTPIRFYNFQLKSFNKEFSINCKWCGVHFHLSDNIVWKKSEHHPEGGLGQLINCPNCHKSLKLNNLVVGRRE